jgi:subtilisin family serine protease
VRPGRWFATTCGFALLVLSARPLRAELDLTRAFAAFAAGRTGLDGRARLPAFLRNRNDARVSLLAQRLDPEAPWPAGATRLGADWCALEVEAERAFALRNELPGFRFDWSPGRRLLLDRADGWIRASSARTASGRSGQGVIIGIVDSGVDVQHPDLRHADGSTRVRWFLDFGRPALGRHPELEAELGCDGAIDCAIYDAADIDELVANEIALDEPRDSIGHGTHVASLAAGNGRSQDPPLYLGVAPEAELVVARVTSTGAGIADADIVRATRFVFERAGELGRPAVANLSLGSDFGAHDGSSGLERALASLVGAEHPGRAIVLAAGNSAGLYLDQNDEQAPPLGVHTELHLPRGSSVSVPLRTPLRPEGDAGMDVWIEMRHGDAVSVGLEFDGRTLLAPVPPGGSATALGDGFEVGLHHQDPEQEQSAQPSANLLIRGNWPAHSSFAVRFEGRGTVALWVQGFGALDPSRGPGPLVPGGIKSGTINVPATHPLLIAVGATLNRSEWVDAAGRSISIPAHGALAEAPADTTAYFSSAGPNSLGVMKPDLVAPGANLIGAMSHLADPRYGGGGLFGGVEGCPAQDACYVTDDYHAVASGSSLSAPLVSGAIALLFEADPSLTQEAVRSLLQAGARPLEGVVFSEQQVGIGALDLDGALSAQAELESAIERVPGARSWLAAAAPYAHPDPNWPVVFHAELRDDADRIADGFDPDRLLLELRGASVVEPLLRLAPGLYRFAVAAAAGSGGESLRVALRFDGREFAARELSIEVDAHAAAHPVSARGGCAVRPGPYSLKFGSWLAAVGAVMLVRRHRRARAAMRVRRV